MKAVILERKGEDAAVLAENGTFMKVRHAGLIGEEIDIASDTSPIRMWRSGAAKILAAAAVVLVVLGGSYHYMAVSVSAYVSVDAGGSSIEFTVNRLGRVTSVTSVSDTDDELVQALSGSVNGMRIEDAVNTAIDKLVESGKAAHEEEPMIVGITSDSEGQAQSLENAIVNNAGHSVHTVRVSDEEREEAHRQELGGGLYVYGHEDADAALSEAESVIADVSEAAASAAPVVSVTAEASDESFFAAPVSAGTEETVIVIETSDADIDTSEAGYSGTEVSVGGAARTPQNEPDADNSDDRGTAETELPQESSLHTDELPSVNAGNRDVGNDGVQEKMTIPQNVQHVSDLPQENTDKQNVENAGGNEGINPPQDGLHVNDLPQENTDKQNVGNAGGNDGINPPQNVQRVNDLPQENADKQNVENAGGNEGINPPQNVQHVSDLPQENTAEQNVRNDGEKEKTDPPKEGLHAEELPQEDDGRQNVQDDGESGRTDPPQEGQQPGVPSQENADMQNGDNNAAHQPGDAPGTPQEQGSDIPASGVQPGSAPTDGGAAPDRMTPPSVSPAAGAFIGGKM